MAINLSIAAPQLGAEDLHALTHDLCTTVKRETDIQADLATGAAEAGAKGDPVTVATIVMAIVTSGAAAKLFDVFKAYFERNSTIEFQLEREDGRTMKIKAENLSSRRIDETIELARDFVGEAG